MQAIGHYILFEARYHIGAQTHSPDSILRWTLKPAVVMNEPHPAKAVHEETNSGASGAHPSPPAFPG
jgi:hypothetical protein